MKITFLLISVQSQNHQNAQMVAKKRLRLRLVWIRSLWSKSKYQTYVEVHSNRSLINQYEVNAFNSHSQWTATDNAQMNTLDPVPQGIVLTGQEEDNIDPYIYIQNLFTVQRSSTLLHIVNRISISYDSRTNAYNRDMHNI